ncbi:MAG TPA: hypothetical protein VMZ29_06505 [Candidatus Bathyarchaeia archaeon]|nr:hypothetical protein [Candidatus Bathyarchaeia archaeon]
MSEAELFDVLKEQLFDRLVNFDKLRKETFTSVTSSDINEICKIWPKFAKSCALSLNQIATASRLERYEYQATLTENIKSLKNNPQAFAVVIQSRDQSILQEFFARALSLLYLETIIEGALKSSKDTSTIDEYAKQNHELSEIILFSLGKELLIDEEFIKMMVSIGKMNFESNIYDNIESFEKPKKDKHKEMLLERKIKNLRYKGTLYKDHYSRILDVAKEDFWWDDQLLRYFIFSKADHLFTEAQEILKKNPIDPTLLLTIDFEIALCRGQAKLAFGSHQLELAINALQSDNHQKAYDFFLHANKTFNESLTEINKVPVESQSSKEIIEQIKANIDFTEIFTTLVALTCSIIEISSKEIPTDELRAQIKSLTSLSEAPLSNIEFYNQSEFLNTVGFLLENLKILSKHEKLTVERIKTEISKGFRRLGLIFKGRLDNIARAFLQLSWEDEQKALEIKKAFCETETTKLQDILISILLMPTFVQDRKILISKGKSLLSIITSEAHRLKGYREKNATKALCLLVKSFLSAKEAYENSKKGKTIPELQEYIMAEYSKTFIQSHLKETSILQTGNQYFFARYLLRTLPDILSTMDLARVPIEIATLIIENHGSMFDSMITIWERISSHYEAILQHKNEENVVTNDIVNWDYILKKRDHTTAAMLFFKSCQALVQAQEFATIKERVKAEKLFIEAEKHAKKSAEIFSTVLDTLKGEVQQLATDLFNFASFCKIQGSKASQSKKLDELPIKDFVVMIGIISSSL